MTEQKAAKKELLYEMRVFALGPTDDLWNLALRGTDDAKVVVGLPQGEMPPSNWEKPPFVGDATFCELADAHSVRNARVLGVCKIAS